MTIAPRFGPHVEPRRARLLVANYTLRLVEFSKHVISVNKGPYFRHSQTGPAPQTPTRQSKHDLNFTATRRGTNRYKADSFSVDSVLNNVKNKHLTYSTECRWLKDFNLRPVGLQCGMSAHCGYIHNAHDIYCRQPFCFEIDMAVFLSRYLTTKLWLGNPSIILSLFTLARALLHHFIIKCQWSGVGSVSNYTKNKLPKERQTKDSTSDPQHTPLDNFVWE